MSEPALITCPWCQSYPEADEVLPGYTPTCACQCLNCPNRFHRMPLSDWNHRTPDPDVERLVRAVDDYIADTEHASDCTCELCLAVQPFRPALKCLTCGDRGDAPNDDRPNWKCPSCGKRVRLREPASERPIIDAARREAGQ